MELFTNGKYLVKLIDAKNVEELKEVQRLRYLYLLRDYNPNLPFEGLDDDGYDKYADIITVTDQEKGIICGTYRLTNLEKIGNNRFTIEQEFNIDNLKKSGEAICEIGRAVVHENYRDGRVIGMLWSAIFMYADKFHCHYLFGNVSIHNTDAKVHKDMLLYLKKHALFLEYPIYSVDESMPYPADEAFDEAKAYDDIPPLLKSYLKMGAKVSMNGYINYDFNSAGIVVVLDTTKVPKRYITFYQSFQKA